MSTSARRKAKGDTLVIEEPPRKVLRLRQPADDFLDISSLDTDDIASVQQLSRIERRINKITDPNTLLVSLIDKLKVAKTAMIQTKIVLLMRKIVVNHKADCAFIAREVTAALTTTDSHQFKNELLSLCASLCPSLKSDSSLFINLMNIAKDCLKAHCNSVRSSAILLMGDIMKYGRNSGLPFEDALGLQLIVIDFIKDPEPRVRSVALETLSDLHSNGVSLEATVYEQASQALTDDYDRVRTAALQLVATLAVDTPSKMLAVKSNPTQYISMLDDGFSKVCDAINDVMFVVRTQAAKLMANFVGVSQDFLEQTLDKKLMSNMRRKQSSHDRQREFYQSGEWSSGKRFADDAPKESVNEDSVSLISMGACGAFVHALEDEFMEVREAAVESMCVLAQSNASYARQTQDFLVDMFNDEIEEVRLQAIQCLCKIAQHLCLRDDQVEIITGVLKDFGSDIRTGVHRLIQACKISTHTGLRDMILALLDNIRKYPEDRRSIWRVMKELGSNHPGLMSPLLPELLSVDPHFEMPEPNMDDDCYVAVMVAVYNAAAKQSCLISLFPSHTERHYRFHRSRFSNLIPVVDQLEDDSLISSLRIGAEPNLSSESLIGDVEAQLARLDTLDNQNTASRTQLLGLCLRDLKHMSNREGTENLAKVRYLSEYIKCLLLFDKIHAQSADGADRLVLTLTQQVVNLCERLLNLYDNVRPDTLNMVRQFQLIALTTCLAKKMQTNSAQPEEFKAYLQQLTKIKRQLGSDGKRISSVERLLDTQETLEAGNWSILQSAIVNLDLTTLSLPGDLSSTITAVKCDLEEPVTRSDKPKRFTAGLAVCLPVRATLQNMKSGSQLYIKVRLPDHSEIIVPVKPSQVTQPETDEEQTLSTRVVFSHGHWSESSYVEVGVLMKTDSLSDMIEICAPNRVYITTRLEKKAHSGNIM